ncbi:alanine racemase [Hwanghaeella sp. 1Z406]|uniref:alanine racemase n=1 Tax=Hwanghaeella sp. 1Z406 TaxID=3402811 RepID=UPI003B675034
MTVTSIAALETPCLLLDQAKLADNIARMTQSVTRLGVQLRPHLKTAKSAKVGVLATQDHKFGITVSTLREAEYFADHGFKDITYAVGLAPGKLDRAAALIARGVDLKVLADTVDAARAIADHGAAFKLLVEIDCGDGRAGVSATGQTLLEIADCLSGSKAARLDGVLTHAGHSYGVNDIPKIQQIAEDERQAVVHAAERLRTAGHAVNTVSAGSTPTALFSQDATGLTEYRAGVYVFFDLDQQSRGVCQTQELALSVLATVIGHNRESSKILLDAGGLALSKDIGANAFRPEVRYGAVVAVDGPALNDVYVTSVSQEHGHVKVTDPALFQRLPVGSRVRILPNHVCMTAAAYPVYNVTDGDTLIDQWDRCNGW